MQPADRERAAALRKLPSAYAFALRLRDADVAPDAIASGLGIDPEALPPLLAIAEAKLAELLGTSGNPATGPDAVRADRGTGTG